MSKNTFKIVVIGDSECGKTCLIKRFTSHVFDDTAPTIAGVIQSVKL